jgi:glycopeptide antibiotics resistance protein
MHPVALLGMTPGQSRDGINTLAGLRFVYLAVAFVTSLLPLDISVSVTRLFDKLAAEAGEMPGLIVDPFYHFGSAAFPVRYLTLKLLPFLPLAVLSAVIQLRRGRPSLLIPAFHCLLFAVVVEFSNLFVQSNRSDTIIPVLAFVAGLAVAAALLWFARRSTASLAMESGSERLYLYLSAGLLYVLFLLVVSLSPYEFELSARAIRTKLFQDSIVVPFLLHFSSRSISSAIDIVREFILYAPFGRLVALWLRGLAPPVSVRTAILSAALIGGAIAFWIEFLQLAVAGRYVDITDILLATCGSTAGAVMAPLFGRGVASGASRPGTEGEPG